MIESNRPPPIAPDHMDETIRSIRRLQAEHRVQATPQQRVMSWIADRIGRPVFIAGLALAIGGWILANWIAAAIGNAPIDPPPFQWLQGAMTLASLLLVVFIVGAQKHEDELNDHREMLALDLAILSEQKSAKIIGLLEEFRRDSPQIHDRVDHEAEAMAQPANPQSMLDAIKETGVASPTR
jgi:uncharacterized membrane protein